MQCHSGQAHGNAPILLVKFRGEIGMGGWTLQRFIANSYKVVIGDFSQDGQTFTSLRGAAFTRTD